MASSPVVDELGPREPESLHDLVGANQVLRGDHPLHMATLTHHRIRGCAVDDPRVRLLHMITCNNRDGVRPERRWFTVPEAATLLGVTKQTLYRRVRHGLVALPRLEGRLVVPASKLEELAETPGLTARPYRRLRGLDST